MTRAEEIAESIIHKFYLEGIDKVDGYNLVKELINQREQEVIEDCLKPIQLAKELLEGGKKCNQQTGKGMAGHRYTQNTYARAIHDIDNAMDKILNLKEQG